MHSFTSVWHGIIAMTVANSAPRCVVVVLRVTTFILLCWVGVFPGQVPTPASGVQARIIREIDGVEQQRERDLAGYSATEHYVIRNTHFKEPGDIVVSTIYRRGAGKTYEVLSRRGPSLLKGKVIDRILEEEAVMSRGEARTQSLLISANYDFRLLGEANIDEVRCWALELTPRRKSPHLLRGRVWVNYDTKALVRIVGAPPVSASLFAGRPEIVRNYEPIEGFALAQRSHAISSGLIQGRTEIDITYENYVVTRARAN